MQDVGPDREEHVWRKQMTRDIDRALVEGRPVDAGALAGGDRAKTAEIEALVAVRSALRDEEGLDDLGDDETTETGVGGDPLAEVERFLSEALERGEPADVSLLEAEHPGLQAEISELKRFYAFLSDALTGEAAVLDTGKKLPDRRLGKFVLERVIAAHPLGRLDAAVEEKTGARFTLLLFNPSLPKTAALRLLRDAVAVRRLADPGFVPVVEVSEAENVRFLALQDVGGSTLDALIAAEAAKGGGSPARRLGSAALITAEIAETLHRAHAHGVLQWDLRPANVVIAKNRRALLYCANLMGALRSAWRGAGSARGYLAPETLAIDNVAVDWRADVFGCGALLFAQLALKPPPADPSAIRAELIGVPAPVVDFVLRCLSPDPKSRPSSCLAVVEALRPYQRGRTSGFGRTAIISFAVAIAAAALYVLFR